MQEDITGGGANFAIAGVGAMGKVCRMESRRSLWSLFGAAIAMWICAAPSAHAVKFGKFQGSYDGTAKIVYDAISYSATADATFKTASNGNGKLTIAGSSSKVKITVSLNQNNRCVVKLQPSSSVTIEAKGTYKIVNSKKITMTLSAAVGQITTTGTATLQMTSNTQMKLSGNLTGSVSGKSLAVQFRYSGKRAD